MDDGLKVYTTSEPQAKPKVSLKLILGIPAGALLLVGLLFFAKINFTNFFKAPLLEPKPAPVVKLSNDNFKKSLVKDIKNSFGSSADAGIMAYMDLAAGEKDAYQSYQNYVSAFNKMRQSYQLAKTEPISTVSANKRLDQQIAMMEFKAYASSLKYYKESDFTIPK